MERDETQLCGELEALLFAAGYPVSYERLAEVMETDVENVRAAATRLCDSCSKSGRGIQLIDFGDSANSAQKRSTSTGYARCFRSSGAAICRALHSRCSRSSLIISR